MKLIGFTMHVELCLEAVIPNELLPVFPDDIMQYDPLLIYLLSVLLIVTLLIPKGLVMSTCLCNRLMNQYLLSLAHILSVYCFLWIFMSSCLC